MVWPDVFTRFPAGWWLSMRRAADNPNWDEEQVSDIIFYIFLGLVLGGRVGYVLFYQWQTFIGDPMYLFRISEGGMSFHGGLLGVIVAYFYSAYRYKKSVFDVVDFFAPFFPIGLGLGRIGNFINGELWGRVADSHYPGPCASQPIRITCYATPRNSIRRFSKVWYCSLSCSGFLRNHDRGWLFRLCS